MDNIIVAVLLLGFCQLVGCYCLSLLIRRAINAKQAEIEARAEAALHEWLDPGPDGGASKGAKVLDAAGAVVGSAAARSIMSALNAEKSHTARAANGLSDVIQAEQNPLLGLLAGGKRGKGAAIAKLGQLLQGMYSGGNSGGDGHASSVTDRQRGQE